MRINKLFAVLAMVVIVFTACEKEDNKPDPLVLPELLFPNNNSVLEDLNLDNEGSINEVYFTWKEKQNNIKYIVCVSTDNSNWTEAGSAHNRSGRGIRKEEYSFEPGKTYYWKLKLFRIHKDGETISDEFIETEVYSFTTDIVGVKKLSFKSSSYTHWPEDYQGTKAFIDLTWEDAPNMEYAEITFTPAVAGIEQPIKVQAGEESLRIDGFEGWGSVAGSPEAQVYEFAVKTYGIGDLVVEGETFKAQPLTKSFVHDYDFNTYIPIKIGEQVWLSSNLRTTHFNDGTPIPDDEIKLGWTDGEHSFDEVLYNIWYGNFDEYLNIGICPEGFRLPFTSDWEKLELFAGMPEDASIYPYKFRGVEEKVGHALKSAEGWGTRLNGSSANGNDVYHFNIKPNMYFDLSEDRSSLESLYCAYAKMFAIIWEGDQNTESRFFSAESDGVAYGTRDLGSIRCILITDEE